MEFQTLIDLSKDVKRKINEYNETEQAKKKEAYNSLYGYIKELLSIPNNRALIYKGDQEAVLFTKTLGKWRMKIWNSITDKIANEDNSK